MQTSGFHMLAYLHIHVNVHIGKHATCNTHTRARMHVRDKRKEIFWPSENHALGMRPMLNW